MRLQKFDPRALDPLALIQSVDPITFFHFRRLELPNGFSYHRNKSFPRRRRRSTPRAAGPYSAFPFLDPLIRFLTLFKFGGNEGVKSVAASYIPEVFT